MRSAAMTDANRIPEKIDFFMCVTVEDYDMRHAYICFFLNYSNFLVVVYWYFLIK